MLTEETRTTEAPPAPIDLDVAIERTIEVEGIQTPVYAKTGGAVVGAVLTTPLLLLSLTFASLAAAALIAVCGLVLVFVALWRGTAKLARPHRPPTMVHEVKAFSRTI